MTLNIFFIWYLVFYFSNTLWTIALENSTVKEKPNATDFLTENVCTTDECRRSAEHILHNMDRNVDPCQDFYQFACGGYRTNTTIPRGLDYIIESYDVIEDRVKNQLKEILAEESPPNELNGFRQAKNLYKSCMNRSALKKQQLKSRWDILKQLGEWPVLEGDQWNETNFNWIETLYKLNDLGFSTSYLIYLNVIENPKNSTEQVLNVEYRMKEDWEDFREFDSIHRSFVKKALSSGAKDVSRVKKEAAHVLGLVQILASIPRPSKLIEMTLANLTQQVPTIPWREYFRRMLPASIAIDDNEVMLVKDPAYFSQFEKLISAVPKRVVANYMMYQAFYKIEDLFNILNSNKDQWEDCLKMVSDYLPICVDALYIRKHFEKDTKTSVTQVVDNVKKQFRINLQNADWLDNSTRKHALDKLDSMKSEIGYAAELMDDNKLKGLFKDLVLDENNELQNRLSLNRFLRSSRLIELRGRTNETKYILSYSSRTMVFSAFYKDENIVVLPGAMLQGYFFHNDRPKYLNYGSIGCSIGHEIVHGFDNKGRKYDKDGKSFNWWTPATKQSFISKAQCLIDQYESYRVKRLYHWKMNGTSTLNENIADIGGIKIAYLAYTNWAKNSNTSEPTLPGLPYNPSQMFWIKAANKLCSAYEDRYEYYFNDDNDDEPHSLDEFRVLGSMSNTPEFSVDFNCTVGSKMNPQKKCFVW